jgi:hypothetical protein
MPDRPAAARVPEPDDPALTRTYLLVLVVEVIVIAALYWVGRHFA